jgi:superfamily II DNA or RNA helicase
MITKDDVQDIAISKTDDHRRCTIVLGTGVGKTKVGLTHLERNTTPLQKVLVVAPKKSIFISWIDDAGKFDKAHLLGRIVFTTYLSINKHDPNDYDIVYLDEVHRLLDSHRLFLDNFKGKILGLTGTPPKYHGSEKGRMVDEFCPVVYSFQADDAVENNILNDYKIFVHMVSLSDKKEYYVKNKTNSFLTSEKLNYQYWCQRLDAGAGNLQMLRVMRMRALMEYPSKERYTKKLIESISQKSKVIVFANTQEQADKLSQYSYHSGNTRSNENLELFKNSSINCLTTVHQLSEGVNIPNLKQGIIMHAYGNERKSAQRIGRLLRLNPDDTAVVHILCYKDTMDEQWVKQALEGFDQSKITYKTFNVLY